MPGARVRNDYCFAIAFWLLCCVPLSTKAATSKIGFIYIGQTDDGGWTYQHDFGRRVMETRYTQYISSNYTQNVFPEDTAGPIIDNYIAQGYSTIVATSVGYSEACSSRAAANPSVKFAVPFGTLSSPHGNMASIVPLLWESVFLTGLTAGTLSAGPFCYLAPLRIPETFAMVNAFALGVRRAAPAANVRVVWMGKWVDMALEAEIATNLLASGCEVLGLYTDSLSGPEVFTKAGKYALGVNSDMAQFVQSDYLLTSAMLDWQTAYSLVAKMTISGNWTQNLVIQGGLGTGMVSLAPFSKMVPDSTRVRVTAARDALKSGEDAVFRGPIYDNQGTLRVLSGDSLTVSEVFELSWLIQGITDLGDYVPVETCNEGHYIAPNRTVLPCPIGTSQGQRGVVFSCTPCPPNSFAISQGSASCTPCPPGTEKNSTGEGECTACDPGHYSNGTGCLPCAPGHYSSRAKSSQCFPCPAGTFSSITGARECSDCPRHATTPAEGSPSPIYCRCQKDFQPNSESDIGANLECKPVVGSGPSMLGAGIGVGAAILLGNLVAVGGIFFFIFHKTEIK